MRTPKSLLIDCTRPSHHRESAARPERVADILPGEAHHRDRLSDQLQEQLSFWLIVSNTGELAHVAGEARSYETNLRHPGAVEFARMSDDAIRINALHINPHRLNRQGPVISTSLSEGRNPAEADLVELAWLTSITDPQQDARLIGAPAFHALLRGESIDILDA
jgi:hypothetical protein